MPNPTGVHGRGRRWATAHAPGRTTAHPETQTRLEPGQADVSHDAPPGAHAADGTGSNTQVALRRVRMQPTVRAGGRIPPTAPHGRKPINRKRSDVQHTRRTSDGGAKCGIGVASWGRVG